MAQYVLEENFTLLQSFYARSRLQNLRDDMRQNLRGFGGVSVVPVDEQRPAWYDINSNSRNLTGHMDVAFHVGFIGSFKVRLPSRVVLNFTATTTSESLDELVEKYRITKYDCVKPAPPVPVPVLELMRKK